MSLPEDLAGFSPEELIELVGRLFGHIQVLEARIAVSMAPRDWATVAEESCTTYLTTDVGKSGKVATIWEREETDLTLRPIFRQSRP